MWNEPSKKQLEQIPPLYSTERIETKDKLIYLHLFISDSDWFIAEFDGDDTFFGYAILNGDYQMAEWGYISFSELKSINLRGLEIDNDLYWKVCRAEEIEKIKWRYQ